MSDQYDDIRDAACSVAKARESMKAGPCLHCGGHLDVDLVEVTEFGNVIPQFARGSGSRCIKECWRADPQAFLDSVVAARP